jgi:hypothetical protein
MTAAAASDLVNQARPSINNVLEGLPTNEYVKVARSSSSTFDVAVLEVLFFRPNGSLMTTITDFINVPMENLDFLSHSIVQDESGIVVEEDRRSLDWNRMLDSNDDYDEILFDPNREIVARD